jgi:hypothetical protein
VLGFEQADVSSEKHGVARDSAVEVDERHRSEPSPSLRELSQHGDFVQFLA